MKIMKKLLSAVIAVTMLSASVVAFAEASSSTITVTTTLMDAEEANYYSLIENASIGLKVEFENVPEEADGFDMHIKIPDGFDVYYKSGRQYIYEAASSANLKEAVISSAKGCDENDIGLGPIKMFATEPTGVAVDGEYVEYDFQCISGPFDLNNYDFMVILCNGDPTSISDKAFEVDEANIAIPTIVGAVKVETIKNYFDSDEPEAPVYPSDDSQPYDKDNDGTYDYKYWSFKGQDVADYFNNVKTITLTNNEAGVADPIMTQRIFLPFDPGTGTFDFNVYAKISDVYQNVTCEIN